MIKPVFPRLSPVTDHIMKRHVKQAQGVDWVKAVVSFDMITSADQPLLTDSRAGTGL